MSHTPHNELAQTVRRATGADVRAMTPLTGGCVAAAYRVECDDGRRVVAKVGASLDTEGYMLRYLAERSALPVPHVFHASESLLVMEYIERGGRMDNDAERHAADLLADLHEIDAGCGYGLECDTLIGGLPQANGWSASWVDFFAQQRLVNMARQAEHAGTLGAPLRRRVETLASRLGEIVHEPEHPSLIHGDVWSGNVLARGGRIAAFIDPAVYYADAEVELAFIEWLSCFGRGFYERYIERRPQVRSPGWEQRRIVYQLYPQLVHACLFGGGYVAEVDRGLRRLGCRG